MSDHRRLYLQALDTLSAMHSLVSQLHDKIDAVKAIPLLGDGPLEVDALRSKMAELNERITILGHAKEIKSQCASLGYNLAETLNKLVASAPGTDETRRIVDLTIASTGQLSAQEELIDELIDVVRADTEKITKRLDDLSMLPNPSAEASAAAVTEPEPEPHEEEDHEERPQMRR